MHNPKVTLHWRLTISVMAKVTTLILSAWFKVHYKLRFYRRLSNNFVMALYHRFQNIKRSSLSHIPMGLSLRVSLLNSFPKMGQTPMSSLQHRTTSQDLLDSLEIQMLDQLVL